MLFIGSDTIGPLANRISETTKKQNKIHNMQTDRYTPHLIALIALIGIQAASAHITYTSRNFGTFTGTSAQNNSITVTNISSDFGWAAATDDNYGDSHRSRAFRFQLASAGIVTLAVQSNSSGFLPAFSIFSGLAHITPSLADHDSSQISLDYLATLSGPAKVGAFFALGDWKIGNDPVYNTSGVPSSGVSVPASLSSFIYQGNAADGTTSNFGLASGINGDGTADGFVTGTFSLPAGDYSIFIGGARLANEGPPPMSGSYTNYGATATLSVIPEPTSALLIGVFSIGLLAQYRRRN